MSNTLIKCKLRRAGGTKISLYGKEYHFKPTEADKADPEASHVCAVPNTEAKAIYRLLGIKEGYELVDPAAELPSKPQADKGQTIADDKADEGEKDIIIENDGQQINLSQMEASELRQLAKEVFKISVHHKWTNATVIGKIIEAMRADAGEV